MKNPQQLTATLVVRYALAVVGSALAIASCGPAGKAGTAFGLPTPQLAEVYATPLVIDWNPDLRLQIESALSKGIAIVAYDGSSIRILPECKISGAYDFAGTSMKQRMLRISDTNVGAWLLPIAFSSKSKLEIAPELDRGKSLEVALLFSGRLTATSTHVKKTDLLGSCTGATHFVRAANLGAFAMELSTPGGDRSAVDVFAGSSQAPSTLARAERLQEGSLEACRKVTPLDSSPVPGCDTPLQLDLAPLSDPLPPSDALSIIQGDTSWVIGACPNGVEAGSETKCSAGALLKVLDCEKRDLGACEDACNRFKYQFSCGIYGMLLTLTAKKEYAAKGHIGPRSPDEARGFALVEGSCKSGDVRACEYLGFLLCMGWGTKADLPRSVPLLTNACDNAKPLGCYALGVAYSGIDDPAQSVPKDDILATRYLLRACATGYSRACWRAGTRVFTGTGTTKDQPRALALLKRACDDITSDACSTLGHIYAVGELDGTKFENKTDELLARSYFERACTIQNGAACSEYAGALFQGCLGPVDVDKVLQLYTTSCDLNHAFGCMAAGMRYCSGDSKLGKDRSKCVMLIKRACELKNPHACGLVEMVQDPRTEITVNKQTCDKAK